jgi:hypothetical protein
VSELPERFLAAARACGPFEVEAQREVTVLRAGGRIMAGVRATRRGLRGHVNLPRRVEDGPFGAVEPLTRELFFHRFALSSAEEIDQRFLGYLREAARWRG